MLKHLYLDGAIIIYFFFNQRRWVVLILLEVLDATLPFVTLAGLKRSATLVIIVVGTDK